MVSRVAQSDGYAESLRKSRTPTENAVATFLELAVLQEKVAKKERELAMYIRDPQFNLKEYVRGIQNG